MKRILLLGLAATVASVLLIAPGAPASGGHGTTWRVTITNLTPPGPGGPGSQPLSPPLLVVHSKKAEVWSLGGIASAPVAAIAEDANNGPAESALSQLDGVANATTGAGGPIVSGASATYMVETRGPFDRLSVVTMLVNTNDGFTGLDSLHLHGRRTTLYRMAYDAGSEANNELTSSIPGPCCGNPFVRDPEGELIRMHPGIQGGGDLSPQVYGWSGPVAKIDIERVR